MDRTRANGTSINCCVKKAVTHAGMRRCMRRPRAAQHAALRLRIAPCPLPCHAQRRSPAWVCEHAAEVAGQRHAGRASQRQQVEHARHADAQPRQDLWGECGRVGTHMHTYTHSAVVQSVCVLTPRAHHACNVHGVQIDKHCQHGDDGHVEAPQPGCAAALHATAALQPYCSRPPARRRRIHAAAAAAAAGRSCWIGRREWCCC